MQALVSEARATVGTDRTNEVPRCFTLLPCLLYLSNGRRKCPACEETVNRYGPGYVECHGAGCNRSYRQNKVGGLYFWRRCFRKRWTPVPR